MDSQSPIEKPDPKVLMVWRWSNALGYSIFSMISLLVLAGVIIVGKLPIWYIGFALMPIALWVFSGLVLKRQWENWTFQVTPEALDMSHGWIWKNRRIVARDRIQHVDINSGPVDRRFGLVQVVVYTAGTTVGMIPGLRPERASALRDQLMAGRAVE